MLKQNLPTHGWKTDLLAARAQSFPAVEKMSVFSLAVACCPVLRRGDSFNPKQETASWYHHIDTLTTPPNLCDQWQNYNLLFCMFFQSEALIRKKDHHGNLFLAQYKGHSHLNTLQLLLAASIWGRQKWQKNFLWKEYSVFFFGQKVYF